VAPEPEVRFALDVFLKELHISVGDFVIREIRRIAGNRYDFSLIVSSPRTGEAEIDNCGIEFLGNVFSTDKHSSVVVEKL
jgi:hypothetical protein